MEMLNTTKNDPSLSHQSNKLYSVWKYGFRTVMDI